MRNKVYVIYLLRAIVFFAFLVLFASCGIVKVGLPNAKESSSIRTGNEAIVLLRVTANLDDGARVGTFDNTSQQVNVNLGLCKYVPQGEVELVKPQRFLSSETKEQGWIYFIVKPGTHYLAFIGTCHYDTRPGLIECQNRLNRARLWQIVLPKDTPIVYIGSMHLRCWSDVYSFQDPVCSGFNEDKMLVQSEENLAKQLASSYLSEFGSIHTVLMKPYD